MSLNGKALAGIDVHALTVFQLYDLERTEPLYLYQAVTDYILRNQVKEISDELFSCRFGHAAFLSHTLGKL